jgi:hypothetical protein
MSVKEERIVDMSGRMFVRELLTLELHIPSFRRYICLRLFAYSRFYPSQTQNGRRKGPDVAAFGFYHREWRCKSPICKEMVSDAVDGKNSSCSFPKRSSTFRFSFLRYRSVHKQALPNDSKCILIIDLPMQDPNFYTWRNLTYAFNKRIESPFLFLFQVKFYT